MPNLSLMPLLVFQIFSSRVESGSKFSFIIFSSNPIVDITKKSQYLYSTYKQNVRDTVVFYRWLHSPCGSGVAGRALLHALIANLFLPTLPQKPLYLLTTNLSWLNCTVTLHIPSSFDLANPFTTCFLLLTSYKM